ncbi:MAG: hypothetical protein JWM76_2491, partial [Pseudonocardiales bacterium]|nr:hypothetical protein [Pseudonocardiales bacterium]
MSIVTEARTYADSTLEQGKTSLNSASDRLFSLTTDTKGLARNAVSLARKQAHVSIGVSDAVLAVITKRSQELPGEARDGAVKIVENTKDRVNQVNEFAAKAQNKVTAVAGDVKDRSTSALDAARNFSLSTVTADVKSDIEGRVNSAKADLETRVTQVKDAINKFADRGEQVATDLRHDPMLVRLISDADKSVEKAANEVTSVAQKLRSRAA